MSDAGLTSKADAGARLAIRLLQDAAQSGTLDPWDVDVISVVDGFLDQLRQRIDVPRRVAAQLGQQGGSYERDLAESSEAFLAASVLVGLKAEVLEASTLPPDPVVEDAFAPDFMEQGWLDPLFNLPRHPERHLLRRPVAPPPLRRQVTLGELIEQLETIAEQLETDELDMRRRQRQKRFSNREAIAQVAALAHREKLPETTAALGVFLKEWEQALHWVDFELLVSRWAESAAPDLDTAISLQNSTPFGLTGGIHTLDPTEIGRWTEAVEVGNAYVNRTTTGAIVQRQPFGGWKRSGVGPGAKAGGPNYVAQLGRWIPDDTDLDDAAWLERAALSDARCWRDEFSVEHDPSGLFCESNVFRYRPLPAIVIRVAHRAHDREVTRVLAAAATCGVSPVLSRVDDEPASALVGRLTATGATRIRVIGDLEPELRDGGAALGIHTIDAPVTSDGHLELQHFLREQSVSRTLHRYGSLV